MTREELALAAAQVQHLVGQSLLRLCIGPGDAQLTFTGVCAVQLESPVHAPVPSSPPVRAHEPGGVALLLPLLDREVTDVRIDHDGGLALAFGDTALWCPGDPAFEAWSYSGPNGGLVVSTPGGAVTGWTLPQGLPGRSGPHGAPGHVTQPDLDVHEATLQVMEGQFQLNDHGVVPDLLTDVAGMVTPLAGGVLVLTGISDGPVRLRAQACATEPPPEPGWDEVAESTFSAPVGDVRVVPLFQDPVPGLPPLTSGPGTYRVRVHARGRDTARGRIVDSPTEEYLLQVWPTRPGRAAARPPTGHPAAGVSRG